eukprot:sb/3469186/
MRAAQNAFIPRFDMRCRSLVRAFSTPPRACSIRQDFINGSPVMIHSRLLLLCFIFLQTSPVLSFFSRRRRAPQPPPIDCVLSNWKTLSPCDHDCGPFGIEKQERTIIEEGRNGGKLCSDFNLFREVPCNRECYNTGVLIENTECSCPSGWKGDCCGEGENFKHFFRIFCRVEQSGKTGRFPAPRRSGKTGRFPAPRRVEPNQTMLKKYSVAEIYPDCSSIQTKNSEKMLKIPEKSK